MFYQHLLFDSGGNPPHVQPHVPEKQHASPRSLLAILAKQSSSMQAELVSPNYTHTNPSWPWNGASDVWSGRFLYFILYCLACNWLFKCTNSTISLFLLINVHAWHHWKIFVWSLHLSTSVFVPSTFVHCPQEWSFLLHCNYCICFLSIVNQC